MKMAPCYNVPKGVENVYTICVDKPECDNQSIVICKALRVIADVFKGNPTVLAQRKAENQRR